MGQSEPPYENMVCWYHGLYIILSWSVVGALITLSLNICYHKIKTFYLFIKIYMT